MEEPTVVPGPGLLEGSRKNAPKSPAKSSGKEEAAANKVAPATSSSRPR